MDKVQEMASFVAVVDAGSFVGAAEALGLSKAAVSRHVGELEKRLGVRLLQRTTRRLSLTAEGQQFQLRCRDLLAAINEAESELSSRSGETHGQLRINAPLTFGVLHLAPLWGRFAQAHPRVALDITLSDRMVDLVDEGYDLAVRISTLPSSNLVSRRLATTRIVLCASPGYLAEHGTPVHPHELAAHRIIGYSYWATRDAWQFDGPEGPVTVRIRPILHANNGDTCRAAALDHQGVILQPDFIVGDDLRSGALVELMPEYRSIELGIHVVYPTRKQLPLRVRRMVDFLVEAFAHPSWVQAGR
ncbi:LysR family transcriptional regulator [Novilysobacter erysipheiresistens]|uniref:LysR family transcriptional regulator n=1 Tax=Novilysobacter erysipheiresistens TaxID=1749332 RepID=A0ABU7YWT1_9GAMM